MFHNLVSAESTLETVGLGIARSDRTVLWVFSMARVYPIGLAILDLLTLALLTGNFAVVLSVMLDFAGRGLERSGKVPNIQFKQVRPC